MDSPKEPDPISTILSAWRVTPRRSREFRREVWARIGAKSSATPWRVFARQHMAAVAGAMAFALVLGALSGHESAQSRLAVERARMAAAYVQGLDARVMQMP
jgi:hypothetical protein